MTNKVITIDDMFSLTPYEEKVDRISYRKKVNEIIDDFLEENDWRVKENANRAKTYYSLLSHIAQNAVSVYSLEKLPKDYAFGHKTGWWHIHDLGISGVFIRYCSGLDMQHLLYNGFKPVLDNTASSEPARHFSTVLDHLLNFFTVFSHECYSEDTRILTKNGWKYFYELQDGDTVATYNMNTGELEFQKPKRFIAREHNGKMIHIKNKRCDLLVTPNHRVYIEKVYNKKVSSEIVLAKDLKESYRHSYTIRKAPNNGYRGETIDKFDLSKFVNYSVCNHDYKEFDAALFFEFIGVFLGDGSLSDGKVVISCGGNSGKTNYVSDILNSLGISYTIDDNSFIIYSKVLYEFFKQFYMGNLTESIHKTIPRYIFEYDYVYLNKLLDGLLNTNGYKRSKTVIIYTSSERLADDISEVAIRCGRSVYVKTKDKNKENYTIEDDKSITNGISYEIHVSKSERTYLMKDNIDVVDYNGMVYCVEVDNSLLFVERNGRVCVCGNCAGAVAVSSLDVYCAPFIRKDRYYYAEMLGLDPYSEAMDKFMRKYVYQSIQRFVWNLNYPLRAGFEALFTNITLDFSAEKSGLADRNCIWAGKPLKDQYYRDYQDEVNLFNKCMLDIKLKGMSDGRPHTFPIITINVTDDFHSILDDELRELVYQCSVRYGEFYFQNCINGELGLSKINPNDVRSMCPLSGDTELLVFYQSGQTRTMEVVDFNTLWNRKQVDPDFKFMVYTKDLEWVEAELTRQYEMNIVRVTLNTGDVVDFGEYHLQPIYDMALNEYKTIQAKDIQVGMLIPYSKDMKINKKNINKYDFAVYAKDGYYFMRVTNVEIIETDEPFYCVAIDTDDHLFMLANGMITHNCRLNMDLKEIHKRVGGFFSGGENVGSIAVTSINLPRIGYVSRKYFSRSNRLPDVLNVVDNCLDESLNVILKGMLKRKELILKHSTQKYNLAPFIKAYERPNMDTYFLTIGFVGLNECLINMGLKDGLGNEQNIAVGEIIMKMILDKVKAHQEKHNSLINVEATPAEGAATRLAMLDKKYFGT